MANNKLIIFTHIQKTAGTTFGRTLKAKYSFWPLAKLARLDLVLGLHSYHVQGDFPLERIQAIQSLSEADRQRVRLLQGHMGFGVHKYFSQPFQYVTVLREPVGRVLSHYNQMRNQDWCPYKEEMRSKSVDTFLAAHPIDGLANFQVKLLAGIYQSTLGNTVPYCTTESTPELLDLAINHLDQYYLLALTELFDESMLLLKATLGWRNAYYIKSNVTKKPKEPVAYFPEVLAVIRMHNRLDIALYDYARTRIEQAISAKGSVFQEDLAEFRVRNRRINRWLYQPVDLLLKAGRKLNSIGRMSGKRRAS
jgi:hypothetical protein